MNENIEFEHDKLDLTDLQLEPVELELLHEHVELETIYNVKLE